MDTYQKFYKLICENEYFKNISHLESLEQYQINVFDKVHEPKWIFKWNRFQIKSFNIFKINYPKYFQIIIDKFVNFINEGFRNNISKEELEKINEEFLKENLEISNIIFEENGDIVITFDFKNNVTDPWLEDVGLGAKILGNNIENFDPNNIFVGVQSDWL